MAWSNSVICSIVSLRRVSLRPLLRRPLGSSRVRVIFWRGVGGRVLGRGVFSRWSCGARGGRPVAACGRLKGVSHPGRGLWGVLPGVGSAPLCDLGLFEGSHDFLPGGFALFALALTGSAGCHSPANVGCRSRRSRCPGNSARPWVTRKFGLKTNLPATLEPAF